VSEIAYLPDIFWGIVVLNAKLGFLIGGVMVFLWMFRAGCAALVLEAVWWLVKVARGWRYETHRARHVMADPKARERWVDDYGADGWYGSMCLEDETRMLPAAPPVPELVAALDDTDMLPIEAGGQAPSIAALYADFEISALPGQEWPAATRVPAAAGGEVVADAGGTGTPAAGSEPSGVTGRPLALEPSRLADTGDIASAHFLAEIDAELRAQDDDTAEYLSRLRSGCIEYRLEMARDMT